VELIVWAVARTLICGASESSAWAVMVWPAKNGVVMVAS
jgi:hypothetical protein